MIKGLIRKFLYTLIIYCQWMTQILCGIKKKKVVFISFVGKSYSDNPRAISEKLHDMDSSYRIVWLFDNPENKQHIVPDYVRCVRNNSIFAFYELATAQFWVDNFNKRLFTYKSKKQYYIQTWHGDRGFKKVLHDSPFSNEKTRYFETNNVDIMTVGSKFGEKKLTGSFRYCGNMLKCGSPRNDIFFQQSENRLFKLKMGLSLSASCKVVLYAPTFRKRTEDKDNQNLHGINLNSMISVLEESTKDSWVCLVRAHFLSKGLNFNEYGSKIINVTDYEDMTELLYIADILITDYSSSAGDYILTNKSLILYHPDYDEYTSVERSLYFKVEESPYVVARTPDELIEILMKVDNIDWKYVNMKIREFYGVYESGKASESVVDWILEKSKQ